MIYITPRKYDYAFCIGPFEDAVEAREWAGLHPVFHGNLPDRPHGPVYSSHCTGKLRDLQTEGRT